MLFGVKGGHGIFVTVAVSMASCSLCSVNFYHFQVSGHISSTAFENYVNFENKVK